MQNVQKFAQYSIKLTCISVCKTLHNFAYMQNCYSNSAYMHCYCSFVYDYLFIFSLSSPLPCQTLSHPFFNIKNKKKKTTTINPELNTLDSNTIHFLAMNTHFFFYCEYISYIYSTIYCEYR